MSVVVLDAAVVVDLLCGFAPAAPFRSILLTADEVAAPAHLDAEVLSALGRLRRAGELTRVPDRLDALAALRISRWPLPPLLSSAWALTGRIAVRDALYVALARSLDATLVTTDVRLRRGAADLVAIAEPTSS